jgi:hypothetical protein
MGILVVENEPTTNPQVSSDLDSITLQPYRELYFRGEFQSRGAFRPNQRMRDKHEASTSSSTLVVDIGSVKLDRHDWSSFIKGRKK